jgi:hypothetical protein
MIAHQIAPRPLVRHSKPVRDPKYLAYVRRLPCVGCKTERKRRDAMHIGPHGLGQKASDLDTVPGCRECHRELHKIGRPAFESKYSIDLYAIMRMARRFFRLKFPAHDLPGVSAPQLVTCECGYEDFLEEFAEGCPECGRKVEERAA